MSVVVKLMVIILLLLLLEMYMSRGKAAAVDPTRQSVMKTILSEDGDIIDCVDIYKQPAFDHPALMNHTIQMKPSYDPTMEKARSTAARGKEGGSLASQLWQRSGSCPRGTIPVLRTTSSSSNSHKPNKNPNHGRRWKKPGVSHRDKLYLKSSNQNSHLAPNRSRAILLTVGYRYLGGKGDIKVWNPHAEPDDYSTSQISLRNGPYYDYEEIESGWAVYPSLYGDNKTRLFVYWTADASQKTGCFDLNCPGFVQTSNEIALGAAIFPISLSSGLPYQITIYIYQDVETKNWWVQYGDKVDIGYWPSALFTELRYNAVTVEWGGEVYSPRTITGRRRMGSRRRRRQEEAHHTKTGMGSGNFPDIVFGKSGSVKRIRIRDNSLELKFPEWVDLYSDEYDCYDVLYLSDYVDDPEFYFGGPGRNPNCP